MKSSATPKDLRAAEPGSQRADGESAPKATLWGSLLAGVAASACCAGPLVFLSLGLGGSWLSTFSKLEPLRPLFILIALAFLGLGYHRLYRVPRACATDVPCADEHVLARQRRVFWITTAVVLAVISFPWWGVWVLDQ